MSNNNPNNQIDLLKVELKEKNRIISELEAKLKAAAAVPAGSMVVIESGLRSLFVSIWFRKMQNLDKRFVYKWIMEMTGKTAEESRELVQKWVGDNDAKVSG